MRRLIVLFLLLAAPAWASPPRVVADIAPVHALVAQVMGDLGRPELLLPPDADPHHFQLRPSQARLLADAALLVWIGPELTPWMSRISQTLGSAAQLQLLSLDTLASRIEDAADHGHDHGAVDPHAWLDPLNAVAFLGAIADALSDADPANAATYAANAAAATDRLRAQTDEISGRLAPVQGVVLVPYHDAYRYFLNRFGLQAAGSITDHDATPPSAARLADIRAILTKARTACVFAEPGRSGALIEGLLPRQNIKIITLDPIGAGLEPGPGLYEALLGRMADAIADCAAP